MKFRKKPVVIDAVLWTGENWSEIVKFMGGSTGKPCAYDGLYIETMEGNMRANPGDWIIKGVHGEMYPCKPDIFEATYEPIEHRRKEATNEQED